ncbi:MAG: 8-amino-7-oxononanoate synthase [Myxococcales bacterium]|nr:8-amino-7-oxononanoate synthase [Myxococcales bacterium]
MRQISGPQAAELNVDGRPVINFSSNNYLGFADHPALRAVARAAMESDGFGAGASRLIVGNLAPHRALESRIAEWKGTDAALLFNSGYQANIGILSALLGPDDAVYSDQLNHASLIDGARLSRARIHVFPHRDLTALRDALRVGHAFRRRLVMTDSIFSMDGDRAPLPELVALAREHDALTLVDDAHAVGVLGEAGIGLCAGLPVDLQMGTLGKALGGFGAYVAGARPFIELLLQRARSFVFTTALPSPVAAFAGAAIDLTASPEGADRRARLANHCARFQAGLRALGLPTPAEPSHIVPIVVGGARQTMALSEALLAAGVFAQGIRPPTVPEGTSRLRFALMATHTDAHIDAALGAIATLRAEIPG